MTIVYAQDIANNEQLIDHLHQCSDDFVPPLRGRVDILEYADKIRTKAIRFEAWEKDKLIGLVAMYSGAWFITNVSVLPAVRGRGIAKELVCQAIFYADQKNAPCIKLDVNAKNLPAVVLYTGLGFSREAFDKQTDIISLVKRFTTLAISGTMNFATALTAGAIGGTTTKFTELTRDTPTAKYAYSFDLEVMHPMMIRTFEPWFIDSPWSVERTAGSCLELGSFEGAFTERLHEHFSDITCIEASRAAHKKMKERLFGTPGVLVHDATFEQAKLGNQYDNIFMTHVLEHVEQHYRVLRRVNEEWLAPGGRFFLACPNANAASRQIAVKMGKLSHNSVVTLDEKAHGHWRTYTLDTLEDAARSVGLKVIARGGIFFKALANFQLDRAMKINIINQHYLEGCYQLGQVYPDLCASIYLICEKGEK